ncbi:MAG: GntR family transcriptional regulator, partial [Candidatus Nanopelagicales bacterium]
MTAAPEGLAAIGGRTSLRERVAESLRAALVSGRMAPGTTYSIPALAEQFGVSATPVREAMLDLVNEGIVAPVPNKGFRVVELTDAELDQITELRRLLEVPTVGALAGAIDRSSIKRLRSLASAVSDAARRGDVVAYVEADRELHLALLAGAGNPRLVEIVGRLRDQSRLYGLEQLAAEGVLVDSANEHVQLIDALESGDRRAAERVMAHHLDHVRGIWASRREER